MTQPETCSMCAQPAAFLVDIKYDGVYVHSEHKVCEQCKDAMLKQWQDRRDRDRDEGKRDSLVTWWRTIG